MARRLSSLDVLRKMTGVFWLDDTATTTTVNGAVSKGSQTIVLTSGASFAIGDEIRIGANGDNSEIVLIENLVTNTVTATLPVSRDIANGEDVMKLSAVDLGATDEGGVNYTPTQPIEDIEAGTQLDVYLSVPGPLVRELSFNLRDFNPENLAIVFGIDESDSNIVDTKGITLNPDDFLSVGYLPWKFEGLLQGGESVTGYMFAAQVAAVNGGMQFAFRTATILPVNLRVDGSQSFVIE